MVSKVLNLKLPRYLDARVPQVVNDLLASTLALVVPEQLERVLAAGEGDIEPSFLGFVDVYEKLSGLISLDKMIVDFGCAYAPQAYYFRKHVKYVGVDCGVVENRFSFENTEHVCTRIQDWIASNKCDLKNTFAICNYVPDSGAQKLVRETFNNVYCYYP